MHHNIYASILVMFLTILCRAGPAADADPQGNQESVYSVFLILCSLCESFCYDVSVHPFCNRKRITGIVGFVAGVTLAWIDGNLFRVSIGACVAVYIAEMILH